MSGEDYLAAAREAVEQAKKILNATAAPETPTQEPQQATGPAQEPRRDIAQEFIDRRNAQAGIEQPPEGMTPAEKIVWRRRRNAGKPNALRPG